MTTPLGLPLFSQTDSADIASKLNAISNAADGAVTELRGEIAAAVIVRQMTHATTYSVPTSTVTPISAWDSTTINLGGINYSGGVFTIPTGGDGLYEWDFANDWPSTTSSHTRQQYILVNGSERAGQKDSRSYFGTVGALTIASSGAVLLAVGDQVQPTLFQTSGGTALVVQPDVFTLRRVARS